jgi:hypothetical protein
MASAANIIPGQLGDLSGSLVYAGGRATNVGGSGAPSENFSAGTFTLTARAFSLACMLRGDASGFMGFGVQANNVSAGLSLVTWGAMYGAGVTNGGVWTPRTDDTWYHVAAVVYDDAGWKARIYKDGVEVASGLGMGGSDFGASSWYARIWASAYPGANELQLDNFVIYDGTLTPAAVAALAAGRLPNAAGILV